MKEKKEKKKVKKTVSTTVPSGAGSHQYAINESYLGLRALGHAPLVVTAMLKEISAGFTAAQIQEAATEYGDT